MEDIKVNLKTEIIAGYDDYALVALYGENGTIAGYFEVDYKKIRDELDTLNK